MTDLKFWGDDRLAEMWCQLNRWSWPSEIQNPEPRGDANPRRNALMAEIVKIVGKKRCMEEWNKEG
jgi:hypothetical protein